MRNVFFESSSLIDTHRFSSLCFVNSNLCSQLRVSFKQSPSESIANRIYSLLNVSQLTETREEERKEEQDSDSSWSVKTDMTSSTLRIKMSLRLAPDQRMISNHNP